MPKDKIQLSYPLLVPNHFFTWRLIGIVKEGVIEHTTYWSCEIAQTVPRPLNIHLFPIWKSLGPSPARSDFWLRVIDVTVRYVARGWRLRDAESCWGYIGFSTASTSLCLMNFMWTGLSHETSRKGIQVTSRGKRGMDDIWAGTERSLGTMKVRDSQRRLVQNP